MGADERLRRAETMSNAITVLDYIARGIGWPVLLLVVLAAVAAFGVFVAAGIAGFVPTLRAVLGVP